MTDSRLISFLSITGSLRRVLFCVGLISIFVMSSSYSHARTTDAEETKAEEVLQSKVRFILKVMNNTQLNKPADSDTYILAVYGRNSESKSLFGALQTATEGKKVNGKPIEVQLFKRLSSVKAADLIYLNAEANVSLRELENKVGSNFVLVTEDFPYGQSMINFVLDDRNTVSYAIQESILQRKGITIGGALRQSNQRILSERSWQQQLDLAESKIKEQELTIENQEAKIDEKAKVIEQKINTIEDQETTISRKKRQLAKNEEIIRYQRSLLIAGIIAGTIILCLLFFLFSINKKRKIALIESEAKTQEILSSINYAERIQRASLPSSSVLEKSLRDGFIFYQPKDIVSGDFYWIEEHDNVVYFAVADCTGHGVPGALLSVLCSNSLSRSINELGIKEPAQILDQTVLHLEDFFAKSGDQLQDGMDIALCRLDKSKNQLQYAGANRPLYYFSEGMFHEIKADRQPIGKYDYRKSYTNHVLHLKQGDSLYLFSDGIVDQFGGEKSKKFTSKRLKELLLSINEQPMEVQKRLIEDELETWRGENEPIDDVCMLGVRFVDNRMS